MQLEEALQQIPLESRCDCTELKITDVFTQPAFTLLQYSI